MDSWICWDVIWVRLFTLLWFAFQLSRCRLWSIRIWEMGNKWNIFGSSMRWCDGNVSIDSNKIWLSMAAFYYFYCTFISIFWGIHRPLATIDAARWNSIKYCFLFSFSALIVEEFIELMWPERNFRNFETFKHWKRVSETKDKSHFNDKMSSIIYIFRYTFAQLRSQ